MVYTVHNCIMKTSDRISHNKTNAHVFNADERMLYMIPGVLGLNLYRQKRNKEQREIR